MNLRDFFDTTRALVRGEQGQTMAEYGVVLAVITVGIILALGALAVAISGKLGDVTSILSNALPT